MRASRSVATAVTLLLALGVPALASDLNCHVSYGKAAAISNDSEACSAASHRSVNDDVTVALTRKTLTIVRAAGSREIRLPLRIELPTDAGAPSDVTLEIVDLAAPPARGLTLFLHTKDIRTIDAISLSEGSYRISASAVGVRPASAEVRVARETKPTTISLPLPRAPRIVGMVRDLTTWKIVPGVQVSTKAGERAVADAGVFSLIVGKTWPTTLLVSAPGYPDTVVRVPVSTADLRLGDVLIGRGGSLALDFVHEEKLVVELSLKSDKEHLVSRTVRSVAADVDHIEIPGLSPGTYLLHIQGPEALEQFSGDLNIAEGRKTFRTVVLTPYQVRIMTKTADHPVEVPQLDVVHAMSGWGATLKTDALGILDTHFWQPGKFRATVHLANGGAYVDTTSLEGEAESWEIQVPQRRLVITLADEETGSEIHEGAVMAENNGNTALTMARRADADGRITFNAIASGRFSLNAMSPGYAEAKALVDIAEGDEIREITIPMHKAPYFRLRVLDASGSPAVRASALASDGESRTLTDENGECTVQAMNFGPARVYVVPHEGSFAIVEVNSLQEKDAAPIVVSVAPGEARLTIRVKRHDGTTVSGVRFALAYNGRPIPRSIMELIEREQMARDTTDSSGVLVLNRLPVGVYQLYPQFPENQKSPASQHLRPLTIAAQPGTNLALFELPDERPH